MKSIAIRVSIDMLLSLSDKTLVSCLCDKDKQQLSANEIRRRLEILKSQGHEALPVWPETEE